MCAAVLGIVAATTSVVGKPHFSFAKLIAAERTTLAASRRLTTSTHASLLISLRNTESTPSRKAFISSLLSQNKFASSSFESHKSM